jgi:hypothetical protein
MNEEELKSLNEELNTLLIKYGATLQINQQIVAVKVPEAPAPVESKPKKK